MIGQMAGNYKILAKLGEGGMGTVWKGLDVMVEREVAVKMLRPEIARMPEIVERFRSEAVTLAKLNHTSIATLFSFFAHGTDFFMVMEFVPGRTLDAVLRERGALPVKEAARIMTRVLDGIEHAHDIGILHRDIKPANIMLTPAGAVKVTDFGIARVLGAARMTREGNIVGTLEYVAPERIRGQESDRRSDIYSLGAVFYEMLAGRTPFQADTDFELMRAQLEQAPLSLAELRADIPPEVEDVVTRALAKDPGERFQSAGEFREALAAAAGPITAERTAERPSVKATRLAPVVEETRLAGASLPAWRRLSNLHYMLIAAAVVLVIGAVVALIALRPGAPAPSAQAPPTIQQPAAQLPAAPPESKPEPPAAPASAGTALPTMEELQANPASEILKSATPVTGELPGLSTQKPKPQQPPPARKPQDAEARRRAALKALGIEETRPAVDKKNSEQQPSEAERRRSALKALEQK